MSRRRVGLLAGAALVALLTGCEVHHERDPAVERRVEVLEREVSKLQMRVLFRLAMTGTALGLVAGFCALWAQDTGREAVGWFMLGLFLAPITLFVLLYLNAQEVDRPPRWRRQPLHW